MGQGTAQLNGAFIDLAQTPFGHIFAVLQDGRRFGQRDGRGDPDLTQPLVPIVAPIEQGMVGRVV